VNFLSTAERLAAIDRSSVTLDPARCLHSVDKFGRCQACFTLCPVSAIQAEKPPVLDQKACQRCLACLPACPTGAFAADDSVGAVLKCAARVEERSIELICDRHPQPEIGMYEAVPAISFHGCLAGLGSGAYLGLASLGFEKVTARLDACEACPWGQLKDQVQAQIRLGQRLLEPRHLSGVLSTCEITDKEDLVKRPLLDAHNPPLSRRDLFRMASIQGQVAAARALESEHRTTGRRPGRERRRTISALDRLPAPQFNPEISLDGLDYATLAISPSCTACRACGRACPTEALQFENEEDNSFRLIFSPRACIGCEACLHVCASDAISINHAPTYAEVFSVEEPQILFQGALARCEHCNILFSDSGEKYCPICVFRRQNIFGFNLPPGLKQVREGRRDDA
jgi:Fe-S-cluster-containing hydrogenase component 2